MKRIASREGAILFCLDAIDRIYGRESIAPFIESQVARAIRMKRASASVKDGIDIDVEQAIES
jgi:hypothetical protein